MPGEVENFDLLTLHGGQLTGHDAMKTTEEKKLGESILQLTIKQQTASMLQTDFTMDSMQQLR